VNHIITKHSQNAVPESVPGSVHVPESVPGSVPGVDVEGVDLTEVTTARVCVVAI